MNASDLKPVGIGAEQRVLTRDLRWLPARMLTVGDHLYALDDEKQTKSGRRYASTVVQSHTCEPHPVTEVHFSDGSVVTCTQEQPLLVRPVRRHGGSSSWRWVRVRNLNDRPYECMKIADCWETPTDSYEVGWMSGFLDGEGCFQAARGRDPWHINVSQLPGPVLDKATRILDSNGFRWRVDTNQNGVHVVHLLGGYSEVLRCLGVFQSIRLLSKLGHPHLRTKKNVEILHVRVAGTAPCVRIETSSSTYWADGMAFRTN